MNLLLFAAAGDDPDDIEGMAKSVGVLKTRPRLCFIATCAAGCGTPVPADRAMCPVCAWL